MSTQSISVLENPFAYHANTVRTAIGHDGEPWFCAKDVFEALEIKWGGSGTSLKNTPEKWICTLNLRGQSGSGDVIFISEPAVYRVIFRSDKPQAIAFAEWVCEEVLPAIRRQGFYGKLEGKDRIALSRHVVDVATRLAQSNDAMLCEFLSRELVHLCNLAGLAMPDLAYKGDDFRQLPLFSKEDRHGR